MPVMRTVCGMGTGLVIAESLGVVFLLLLFIVHFDVLGKHDADTCKPHVCGSFRLLLLATVFTPENRLQRRQLLRVPRSLPRAPLYSRFPHVS